MSAWDKVVAIASPIILGLIAYFIKRFIDGHDADIKSIRDGQKTQSKEFSELSIKVAYATAKIDTFAKEIESSIRRAEAHVTEVHKEKVHADSNIGARILELRSKSLELSAELKVLTKKVESVKEDTGAIKTSGEAHHKSLAAAAKILKNQEDRIRQMESDYGKILTLVGGKLEELKK